jgi:hypothetical protein
MLAARGQQRDGLKIVPDVVERYFGADVAQRTAAFMEHEGGR